MNMYRLIERGGDLFFFSNYYTQVLDGLSHRELGKRADFIITSRGFCEKNRWTGKSSRPKDFFNWRERFRVFFTGKI